jgi:DNA-binding transcriptional ArsR family regulator
MPAPKRQPKIDPSLHVPVQPRRADLAAAAGAAAGELDRLVHERLRLGILSALAARAGGVATFNDLKALLGATDGNVSVHARKLEEAGYIACTKSFDGRVPRTEYRITPEGRDALDRYLDHMEALIRAARGR